MDKDFIVGPLVRRIYLIRKDPNSKVRFLGVDCSHCGHPNDVDGAEFPDLDAADAKIKELTQANENLAANNHLLHERDGDSWKVIADGLQDKLAEVTAERDLARIKWQEYERYALNEAHEAALLRTKLMKERERD